MKHLKIELRIIFKNLHETILMNPTNPPKKTNQLTMSPTYKIEKEKIL
jgi:hypothetical protein